MSGYLDTAPLIGADNVQDAIDAIKTAVASGTVAIKDPCRVGTTTAGGNITLAGGAPNTLDGVALVATDRILVKNQTLPAQNGIYVVSVLGGGANGTWTRATDFDASAEVVGTVQVGVQEGTPFPGGNADTFWFVTSDGVIVIGVDPILWSVYPTTAVVGATTFVFRPGGVAVGNVFTDFNNLYAASLMYAGPKIIQFDEAFAPVGIPVRAGGGAYNMRDVSAVTVATDTLNVDIADGVTFDPFFCEATGCNFFGRNTLVPTVTVTTFRNRTVFNYSFIEMLGGSLPFFQIDGGGLELWFVRDSRIKAGASIAVDTINAGSVSLSLYDGGGLPSGMLSSDAGSGVDVYYDASSTVSQTQPTVLGFLSFTLRDDASRVAYTPAVSTNWSVAPTTAQEGLDQAAARKRSFFNPNEVPGVKVVLYIRTTGNDDTGVPDNVARPFHTTEGALRFVAQAPTLGGYSAGYYELNYGAGVFPLPAALPGWAGITSVVTNVTVSDTRSVTAVVQNTPNGGNAVTLNGAVVANGAWRGEIVEFLTAGLVHIAYGTVQENVGNTIYFETDDASTINPVIPVTAVVRFLAQNTVFTQPTSGTVFSGSDIVGAFFWTGGDFTACSLEFQGGFGCNFFRAKMGGVTVSDTLQIVWQTCTFTNSISVKSGGNAWVGDGSTFLDSTYGAYVEGGLLIFTGVTAFARITKAAIVGVGVNDVSEYTGAPIRLLRVIDCPYVLRVNAAAEYRLALGGSYYLPRCATTAGLTGVTIKAITATGGAQVRLGDLSNIVIGPDTNPVSADGGATACSSAVDGTRITGGTPTPGPAGFTYRAVLGDSPLDPLTDQTLGVQTSGGTPVINIPLPDVTQITPGARWTVNFEVGAGVGGRDVTLTPSLGQTVGMALGAFSLTTAGVGSIDLIANPSGNWLKA
jgi:hypothetical protein